jgi:hypothetical protein
MSLSDAAKPASQSKPIWREIRARLTMSKDEPRWLSSGPRRSRRRLCRLLIAELLRDEATSAQGR